VLLNAVGQILDGASVWHSSKLAVGDRTRMYAMRPCLFAIGDNDKLTGCEQIRNQLP
jgi:hypothetical protein